MARALVPALVLSALLAGVASVPASAANMATPLTGEAMIDAAVGAFPSSVHQQLVSDSWTATPHDLAAAVDISVNDATAIAQVTGNVSAHWASPDAGNITFSNMGWTVSRPDFVLTSLCGLGCGSGLWSYTFTAQADGGFHMSFDTSEQRTPDKFPFGWQLSNGGGVVLVDAGVGAFDGFPIVAGQTYTASISSNLWLLGQRTDLENVNASLEWSITTQPVPEPQTWALMIIGSGLVGSILRAHRRQAAAGSA